MWPPFPLLRPVSRPKISAVIRFKSTPFAMAMWVGSVGSRDRVVVPQVLADARAGRLVTRGEVQLAGNRPGGDVERGLFPLEILLLKALFVVTLSPSPRTSLVVC